MDNNYSQQPQFPQNQPQQFPQYPQPKPKKKLKKWQIALIVVGVIVVLAAIGGANQDKNSDTPATSATTSNSTNNSNTGSKAEKETAKPTEKPTEKPTKSPAETEKEFKDSCETIEFETLSRNPDKYKGNNYKFTGEVIQVQDEMFGDTVDLRINVTKQTYEYIDSVTWKDTIYATIEIPDGEDRILEDDVITFWGTCDGIYKYTSVLGSEVSLPKIDIKYYELTK